MQFLIQVEATCDDYEEVTVHLHDESSGEIYSTTANITPLPDGRRRLVAHFPNIPEDTQYRAISEVHYTERSTCTQHSNQVNTSEYDLQITTDAVCDNYDAFLTGTFDIDLVNYTIIDGFVHITVGFVEGAESHSFCVKVMCKSENISVCFNGSSEVVNNMPRNELCTLLVTDVDAMNLINLRPAFLANIQVYSTTEVPPTTSVNVNSSPTPTTIKGFLMISLLLSY